MMKSKRGECRGEVSVCRFGAEARERQRNRSITMRAQALFSSLLVVFTITAALSETIKSKPHGIIQSESEVFQDRSQSRHEQDFQQALAENRCGGHSTHRHVRQTSQYRNPTNTLTSTDQIPAAQGPSTNRHVSGSNPHQNTWSSPSGQPGQNGMPATVHGPGRHGTPGQNGQYPAQSQGNNFNNSNAQGPAWSDSNGQPGQNGMPATVHGPGRHGTPGQNGQYPAQSQGNNVNNANGQGPAWGGSNGQPGQNGMPGSLHGPGRHGTPGQNGQPASSGGRRRPGKNKQPATQVSEICPPISVSAENIDGYWLYSRLTVASWGIAQQTCRSYGMNLVSVQDSRKLAAISSYIRKITNLNYRFWSSGRLLQGKMMWYYQNQQINQGLWNAHVSLSTAPEGQCVVILNDNSSTGYKFALNSCARQEAFICELQCSAAVQ